MTAPWPRSSRRRSRTARRPNSPGSAPTPTRRWWPPSRSRAPTLAATLSYASGAADIALLGDTIGENLDRAAEAFAGRDALVECWSGRRWTYREFVSDVDVLAAGLLDTGLATGDRVGIWAPNCAEWTIAQYATAKIGAILVTVNPAYRAHELEYVLSQAGVRMLIADAEYASVIDEVRPRCAALAHVVLLGGTAWAELLERGRRADPQRLAAVAGTLSADDPVNIQYTSGTTGFPKGATLSHHNILNNGFFVGELCGYSEADRICLPVPFYHCFGMVMGNLAATSHGACMVIPAPSFEAKATLGAVSAERCTSLYGVPTMFIAELAELSDSGCADYDLTSLRTGIMAGSPCPVEVMRQVIERMGIGEIAICYGMTETSPVSTQTRPEDSLHRRVSTVGTVHPHLEIRIVDPSTAATVPRGDTGELCTRGYSVMLGYWERPDWTADAIDAGRWMHTGDLAVMDDDGYVTIVGRIKDMVIRGGENIYPREIEEFLHTHPDILDAQVIGVPDAKYGEELMAWIRMRPGADPLTEQTLRGFCTGELARYKIPRYVHVVDEFPMTITGKVRKVQMREAAIKLLGLRPDQTPPEPSSAR